MHGYLLKGFQGHIEAIATQRQYCDRVLELFDFPPPQVDVRWAEGSSAHVSLLRVDEIVSLVGGPSYSLYVLAPSSQSQDIVSHSIITEKVSIVHVAMSNF